MLPDILDGVDGGVREMRRFETVDPESAGLRPQAFRHRSIQVAAIADAQLVGLESRLQQIGATQYFLAEDDPFLVVLDGDRDVAVAAFVDAVWHYVVVPQPPALVFNA